MTVIRTIRDVLIGAIDRSIIEEYDLVARMLALGGYAVYMIALVLT